MPHILNLRSLDCSLLLGNTMQLDSSKNRNVKVPEHKGSANMACWTWNKKSSITWVIRVLKLLPKYFKSTTVSNDDTNYGIIGPHDQPKCLPTRVCIQISQGFSATKTKASGLLQGYSAASNNWGLTTNMQALVCTPHKKLTSCWLFHPAPPNVHCLLSPTVTLCVHVPIGYDIFCAFVCKTRDFLTCLFSDSTCHWQQRTVQLHTQYNHFHRYNRMLHTSAPQTQTDKPTLKPWI
jgi:hypothetical protein